MTTYEDMADWPQTEVSGARGRGWVKAHPFPAAPVRRLVDAWAVFRGRAIAVRPATAEDAERLHRLLHRRPRRDGSLADAFGR